MRELWDQAILLLPSTKDIDSFYLCYRPWIRNKSRIFRVTFLANNYAKDTKKWFMPWKVEGFGSTPEEALQDFIDKWNKYVSKFNV